MKNISRISLILVFSLATMGCYGTYRGYQDLHDKEIAERNSFYCQGMALSDGIIPIEVHKLSDDKCYPVGIFSNPAPPDKCPNEHYHYPLLSLDGVLRGEQDPDCGAATSQDIYKTGVYFVSHTMAKEWNKKWRGQTADLIDIDFMLYEGELSPKES